jgi:hypothetical protein
MKNLKEMPLENAGYRILVSAHSLEEQILIVVFGMNENFEFVTWTFNSLTGGFENGAYSHNFKKITNLFDRKIERVLRFYHTDAFDFFAEKRIYDQEAIRNLCAFLDDEEGKKDMMK